MLASREAGLGGIEKSISYQFGYPVVALLGKRRQLPSALPRQRYADG